MKRIIIVVEGQTEQEFVKQSIQPYMFSQYGIHSVSARLIGKPGHKGGVVKYARLRSDLNILLHEKDTVISTLIDYFKLGTDFPNYEICQHLPNTEQKIEGLEQELANAIGRRFFIPYIQKYEFEALLFSSTNGYEKFLKPQTCEHIEKIIQEFRNPENINNDRPPSYRLIETFDLYEKTKYDKVLLGNTLALEIGMEKILERCPRFANWIDQLGRMSTQD